MNLSFILAQATTKANAVADKVIESNVTNSVKESAETLSIWNSIMDSDPIVKFTLLLLLFFSVMCWAIIVLKIMQLNKAQKSATLFWQKFSSTPRISDLSGIRGLKNGPVYEIFDSGNATLGKIKNVTNKMTDHYRNLLVQRVNQAKEDEIYKLEQYVPFLATTASVAPFIGLFGTVWGILTAFMKIGQAGSSSLATVGPYIAEALVATAVGLFAAIPAVIAYNYFVGKVKLLSKIFDMFVEDFMLKSENEVIS